MAHLRSQVNLKHETVYVSLNCMTLSSPHQRKLSERRLACLRSSQPLSVFQRERSPVPAISPWSLALLPLTHSFNSCGFFFLLLPHIFFLPFKCFCFFSQNKETELYFKIIWYLHWVITLSHLFSIWRAVCFLKHFCS